MRTDRIRTDGTPDFGTEYDEALEYMDTLAAAQRDLPPVQSAAGAFVPAPWENGPPVHVQNGIIIEHMFPYKKSIGNPLKTML